MKRIKVAAEQEIPLDGCRVVSLDGKTIAVFRTSGGIFAVDDSCPHRGGPLSEGDIIDGEVVCPWHFWAFDLKTGCHAPSGGEFTVPTWSTEILDGIVYLLVPEEMNRAPETVETC